jgi:hypothetical protein
MNRYAPYAPHSPKDFRCFICLEDDNTERTEAMSHGGCGDLHPVHKECATTMALYRSACPACRTQINTRSLIPWRRRVVTEVGAVAADVVRGMSGATYGAGSALWGASFGHFLGSTIATRALVPMTGGAGFLFVLGTTSLEPMQSRRAVISRIAVAALFGVIGTPTGISLPVIATVVGTGMVLAVANGIFERYFA